MANEDFVVRFGSNAATFKDQLKRDIVEVNGLVSQLRTALQQGAQLKIAADGKLLRGPGTDPTIQQGGKRGGGSSDPHHDAAVGRLVDNLESYTQTLGGVIRSMDGAARLIERAALATANRTSGKNRSEAAAAREAANPDKSNLQNVRKVHEDALKAALDGGDHKDDPFAGGSNIKNVPRVEIDAAQLDRIAQNTKSGADAQVATNRKMDHLIGLINKGLSVRWDGKQPPGAQGGDSGRGGGKGGGGKGGGTPAEPKGTPDTQQDPFSRVAQLRRFIQKREREQALFKELARLEKGDGAAPTGAALKTLTGGSKGFTKVFNETGGTGEAYRSRVQKAIDSTRSELADVPRLKTLRSQLTAAIDATGTPDGRLSRDERKARAAQQQTASTKKPTTTSSGARAGETAEAKNARLQRLATESLAIVKGYQVVVSGLSEAVADVEAGRKQAPPGIDLQAKLAKAKQDLAEAEAAHKRAEAKTAGTRAERKAANRAEAEAVRQAAGPQITGRAARERLDNLDLAGSRDALQGLPVRRLREIASQFRTEGYDVKVPRGAKKEDLVGILNTVHGEFEKAGRATNSNLEARAQRHAPTTISPAARNAIGSLLGKVVQDVQSAANQEIISAAYKGGFAPGQSRQKASAEGAGRVYPVQNNRDEISGAEESLAQRAARIARQATREGRSRLLAEPGFDPFHKDVEITGTGTGARDARFALRAIQEVVNRFDKLGQAALRAHDDLDKMNARLKRLDALEKRADALSRSGLRTDAEKSQYTGVLADIKALKPRIEADQARRPQVQAELDEFYRKAGRRADRGGLGIEVPKDFFSRQNFGTGFDARAASRDARLTMEMQRNDARAERITKATSSTADVSAAVREALFGARNVAGFNGQVGAGIIRTGQSRTAKRVDQARMLPDVFNPELMARDFPKAGQDDILAAQRETRRYEKAIKKQRQMEQANRLASESGGPAAFSAEEVTKQGARIDERLKRLFSAIDKITGQATAKAEREEMRLRMVDPYGNVEAKNTRQSKAKQFEPSGVVTTGMVSRAEAIIAGGQVTKDMPMLMGRLARASGMDYKTDVKGVSEYQGIEGLRRLLARALQGPQIGTATSAAGEIKEAAKKGKQSGFDDDCCTKIVAGLNRIVETLRGGVRFTGPNGQEATGTAGGARVAGQRGRSTGATTPEEREARKQRIREEFALAEQRGQRRLGKARAQEQTAATSQTMKEAAATAELAKTLSQLDNVTKGHIERLRQQKAAGADAATQYRTMQDVYRTGAATLRQVNPTEGVGRRSERLGGVISSAVGTQIPQRDIRRMGIDIENELSGSIRQAAESNAGNRGPLAEALFGGKGFMSRVLNSTGTFLVRNFTAGFVFGITNALQDVIMQALETEATFIRISSALEATGRVTGGLRTGLQDISTDYGVALKDVYTTAAGLTGIFATNEELEGGTRIAAQLQSISRGALNSTEAMKALASVTTAFGSDLSGAEGLQTGLDGLNHVADVLTVIQDRMGVNIEDTVEGVGRLAGQAKQLGFNFEEVAVYVAAVSKLTNQTGQAAGEQLSRIFSQLQSGPGQAALMKNLGPSSGIAEALGTRDYSQTMDILLDKYNELGKAEKDQIALALGGARQAAAINALLEQGAKVRDTVRAATDASGQADKRAAEIAETLNAQVQRLQTNFQNLGSAIVRSGLLNGLGAVLVVTNKILGGFNTVLSVMNDIADSNPITRWARDVGLGMLGALAAIKLLMVGVRALKGVMATAGLTSGSSAAVARAAAAAGGVPFIGPGGTPGVPGGAPGAPVPAGARAGRNIRFLPYLNPFRGFGTGYDDRKTGSGLWRRSQANRQVPTALPFVPSGRAGLDARLAAGVAPGMLYSAAAPGLYTGSRSLSTRLAQGLGVRSSRFASNISQLGQRMAATAAPTVPGYMRQQAGRALMGPVTRGANIMGRAFTSLGSVLQRSALAAAAASAAMSALAIALGAVIIDAMRARQFRKDLKNAFDADVNNETEEGRAEQERYANRYGELVKKNNESNENFFGMGGVRSLSRGLKNIVGLIPGVDTEESAAEAVGDYSGSRLKNGRNVDQAIFQQMQTSFGRIRDVNVRSKSLRADAATKGTLLAPETQEGINAMKAELDEASKVSAEEIEKLKNDIMSSDMSDAQKAGALAQLQDIQESVANSAAKARLTIMGLNNLNVLGGQQMDMLTSLMSSVQSGGASTGEFSGLIKQMAADIGMQEGSDYLKNTLGLADEKTGVGRMELMRDNERLNLQQLEAKLSDPNLDPQLREDLTKQAQAALGRYEQLQVGILQAHIAGATAMAAELRASGDYEGARTALDAKLSALAVELERFKDDPYQTAILEQQQRQARFEVTEIGLEPSLIKEQEARSLGRDQVGNAGSEVREARAVLDAYEADDSGATAKQISDARIRYNQALKTEADAINNRNQAQLQQQIAGTLNAATRATLEEAAALTQVSFARQTFGEASAEYAQAMARYLQTQEATFQANEAETAAASQTRILSVAPGDAKKVADERLAEALRARDVARRYGETSTQYQQANQQVLQAQREVTNAVYDMAAADAEMQIALAEAAGDRVGVARAQAAEAERLYQTALAQAGGNTGAATVVRANAGRVRANGAERDAVFNDAVGTIDFQREMGEISANTAISLLQELLRQTNLTEEQRRSLRLKIKGLQADVKNALTGSGFNIPDQIKLPTAYEVRRSLGVDPYVAAGNAALKDLQAMSAQSAMGALTMTPSTTPTASTTVVNNNNTPVVVNNTVSTPAMVEAVARRVVELISTQTNIGARANQTSPSLVRY